MDNWGSMLYDGGSMVYNRGSMMGNNDRCTLVQDWRNVCDRVVNDTGAGVRNGCGDVIDDVANLGNTVHMFVADVRRRNGVHNMRGRMPAARRMPATRRSHSDGEQGGNDDL